MFRPFIVPLSIAALLMVGGVVIAIQPIVDPGYVHPLGLLLTGMFFTVCGVAFTATCIGFAFSEKRDRAENARAQAREQEIHLYGTAGWGAEAIDISAETLAWEAYQAGDMRTWDAYVNRDIPAVSGVAIWSR